MQHSTNVKYEPVAMLDDVITRYYHTYQERPECVWGTRQFYRDFMNVDFIKEAIIKPPDDVVIIKWVFIYNGVTVRCQLPQKGVMLLCQHT